MIFAFLRKNVAPVAWTVATRGASTVTADAAERLGRKGPLPVNAAMTWWRRGTAR